MSKEHNEIIELGTGLPMLTVAKLDDENPTIEVDWYFLRMVIIRLRRLKETKPSGIAKNDIPQTMELINKLKDK